VIGGSTTESSPAKNLDHFISRRAVCILSATVV
jgi:hypothetical protein